MKVVKTIWNTVATIIVCLVVCVALLLVGARLFGLDVYMVLSGSMEPEYHTGSIVYVKEVDPYSLKVGDDITYMLNEDTIATHRIVEVIPDEEDKSVVRFRTMGIANDKADEVPVHYKNVIGSPVYTIPYLGYVANYVQNPPGMYVAIAAGALLILLCFLPDLLFDEKKEDDKKKGKDNKKAETVAEGGEPPAGDEAAAEETDSSAESDETNQG